MINLHANSPHNQQYPAIVVVVLIVCVAAFVGGVLVATLWQNYTTQGKNDASIVSGEVESDGLIQADQVPIGEVEYTTQPGVLNIEWFDVKQQTTVSPDFVFIDAWCSGYGGYNTCEGEFAVAPPYFVKLGTVRGGTYDGYQLEMATSITSEMGTNYTFFIFFEKMVRHQFYLIDTLLIQSIGFQQAKREGT